MEFEVGGCGSILFFPQEYPLRTAHQHGHMIGTVNRTFDRGFVVGMRPSTRVPAVGVLEFNANRPYTNEIPETVYAPELIVIELAEVWGGNGSDSGSGLVEEKKKSLTEVSRRI